jgi:hypothetical protein
VRDPAGEVGLAAGDDEVIVLFDNAGAEDHVAHKTTSRTYILSSSGRVRSSFASISGGWLVASTFHGSSGSSSDQ